MRMAQPTVKDQIIRAPHTVDRRGSGLENINKFICFLLSPLFSAIDLWFRLIASWYCIQQTDSKCLRRKTNDNNINESFRCLSIRWQRWREYTFITFLFPSICSGFTPNESNNEFSKSKLFHNSLSSSLFISLFLRKKTKRVSWSTALCVGSTLHFCHRHGVCLRCNSSLFTLAC